MRSSVVCAWRESLFHEDRRDLTLCVRLYGCAAVRLCGCAAVRLCGCAAVRLCGCAAVRLCGCAAVRLCGCAAVRLCGCAAVRLCGCAAVRLCGCAAVRLCGCTAVRLYGCSSKPARDSLNNSGWNQTYRTVYCVAVVYYSSGTQPRHYIMSTTQKYIVFDRLGFIYSALCLYGPNTSTDSICCERSLQSGCKLATFGTCTCMYCMAGMCTECTNLT